MATTKLGNTKSASRAINYAEKRAEVKSGHNLDIDYAKSQMKMTRSLYGKEDGIQAHTIIQSFSPGEVTSEKANDIGQELAKKIAENHQVAVYTHADTEHIHNHIVISSVNLETGNKYQSNAEQRHLVKDKNDEICHQHELSVVQEKSAKMRYTLAEQGLIGKEKTSWKDEIREDIQKTKEKVSTFDDFRKHLEHDYGIETKLRGQTLSYKHPDRQRFVRANKLGADYEKEGLEHEFTRKARTKAIDWGEYEQSYERIKNQSSGEKERINSTANRPISERYRGEQQALERQHNERLKNERERQQEVQRKNRKSPEQSKGLSL